MHEKNSHPSAEVPEIRHDRDVEVINSTDVPERTMRRIIKFIDNYKLPEDIYIRSKGGDPETDFVDPALTESMTPEGRSLVKRVLGSTPLRIHIMETNSLRRHRPDSEE